MAKLPTAHLAVLVMSVLCALFTVSLVAIQFAPATSAAVEAVLGSAITATVGAIAGLVTQTKQATGAELSEGEHHGESPAPEPHHRV